jgi:hypothetical protein
MPYGLPIVPADTSGDTSRASFSIWPSLSGSRRGDVLDRDEHHRAVDVVADLLMALALRPLGHRTLRGVALILQVK